MVKGILWDNDGVLVDTEHLFYAVNRDLLLEHGVALSEDNFFHWYLAENHGAWHILLQNGATAEEIAVLREERNRRYAEHQGQCHQTDTGCASDSFVRFAECGAKLRIIRAVRRQQQ